MKKVILSLIGVVVVVAAFLICISMYKQSGFAVHNQYYAIVKKESSLKKLCNDPKLYKFIRKNYKNKVDFTDNQGSGRVFYYVATYGKKSPAIGVKGNFVKSGSKITKIFNADKQSN